MALSASRITTKHHLIRLGSTSPSLRGVVSTILVGRVDSAVGAALRTLWESAHKEGAYNLQLLMLEHPSTPPDVLESVAANDARDTSTLSKVYTHPNVSDETAQWIEGTPAFQQAFGNRMKPRSRVLHGW